MNPVREAIEATLGDASALTALLSSRSAIYHRLAPRTAAVPYVILNKQSGVDVYAFGVRAFLNQVWLVKAVDRGRSSALAEDAAAQIDAALFDATLTLSTGLVVWCRRESEVDFSEDQDSETFHHVGGLYRLVSTP